MKHLLAILFVVMLATPAAAQDTVTGMVTHVRDGDTIEVGDIAVRLDGVAVTDAR